MRFFTFAFTLLLYCQITAFSQGVFVSASGGSWNSASRWTLISGSDADGIPDSNDNVTIQSGYNISISATQACNNLTFNNGTISFSSNNTVTINGNVSVIANSTVAGYSNNHVFNVLGNLNINNGITLNVGANNFTIAGTTTVNGTLAISGYGAKPRNFGNLIINSGATMTVGGQDLYTFSGNVTNNGTFTANDQTEFRFVSATGTIGGANPMSMYKVVFNSPANYTNNGNLAVRNDMSGTGSFTNGAGGNLELQNSGPFTVSTFNASATGNTITYTGYGNPTSFSGNYYNLVLNKSSGSLSFGSSLSVLNDLTIQDGILQVNAVTLNIGNDLILEDGEFTPDNASAVVNISGDFIGTGGEYDHNNGDVNVTGNVNISGSDFLFSGASSTLDAGSFTMNNAAITFSSGTITTTGNFTLNGTSNLIVNNAAATLAVGGEFSLVSGTTNLSRGDFSAGSINVAEGKELVLGNIPTSVTGTTTINGTITFNSSGSSKNFNTILVNSGGSWAVTQPNNFTVSGNITNNGSFTSPSYGSSIYTLTSTSGSLNGSGNLSLRDILINSPASYTNNTDLTVAGTLNGTGTFINGAGATLRYQGDNSSGSNFTISNFTASATGNTVVYGTASSSQRWRATSSANNDYYNVTLDFTGTGDYQRLQLVNNVRVNGTLNIIAGDPVLNTYNLELASGANVTGGNATEYIRQNSSGVIRKYFSATGQSVSLPMGDDNDFSPITNFTLNGGTLGANPYVNFSVTDANHPNRNTDNTASGGDDDGTAAVSYLSRYWTVTGNDITDPSFSATYQYVDADVTGTESDMVAALRRTRIGGMGPVLDWKEAGTVNPTTNTVSLNSGDGFGDMYAMDNTDSRLPIVLLSFTAEVKKAKVQLSWSTASELDNDFFTIERSQNGLDFEPILFVSGKGSSEETNTYTAFDDSPILGRNYYRLKQTDFNGAFELSEVISVMNATVFEKNSNLKVYPNAVYRGNYLNIQHAQIGNENVILKLISLNSSEILEITEKGDDGLVKLQIPTALKSGVYILKVINGNFTESLKVFIK
ncbi:hypothetical protein EV198_0460 [Roseivirga ehrenbergii]|uniref:Secretion system C-terminal sorting domain-containing protein n=1 Tax=Roseivirga ehrenbergii (strain DSM 102268 / JCM 13514 / KCTC 12282 / NCIMB 14502 / KMM 6017) TaxID=279360 RepID=A0A150X8F1_ROSEK|nr:T9SS type A sorting domain-containing protein [Roseivirga ehrenbergii]KYG75017.1 hypothetical protein MB14_07400 [Roseivirga ehrenbergii]TCL13630.1 hypothetical protein EV198_0460 [Roseivirga ehrenbergii]